MNKTSILKKLPLNGQHTFDIAEYTTISAICSRLKRIALGSYALKRSENEFTVTRLTLPVPLILDERHARKELRLLREAAQELRWKLVQLDPETDNYEVYVCQLQDGKSHRIRIPAGEDFKYLVELLERFTVFRTEKLKDKLMDSLKQ